MGERPRPGLPSRKDCYKQSDPEQFKLSVGSEVAGRMWGVGNPVHATLCTPTPSSFVSPCWLGKNLGFRLRSQTKLITQSVALRYQFAKQMLSEAPSVESAKRMKVNVSSFFNLVIPRRYRLGTKRLFAADKRSRKAECRE